MVIAKIGIKFVAPAFGDDVLLICHRVTSTTDKAFELECLLLSYRCAWVAVRSHKRR
jgi:hypothetical protein